MNSTHSNGNQEQQATESQEDQTPEVNIFESLKEQCFRTEDKVPYLVNIDPTFDLKIIFLDDKLAVDYYIYKSYKDGGDIVKRKTAKELVDDLRLYAKFDAPIVPIKTRVQKLRSGIDGIELKLNSNQSVKVTAGGIEVGPHIGHFNDWPTERDLAVPDLTEEASIEPYLDALGITDNDQKILITGFLLMSLMPDGPYPMMVIKGSEGAGKSTLTKFLKRSIDPSGLEAMTPFKNKRDLYVAARQLHVMTFDNVSEIKPEMSNAHCMIATGAQLVERELYSNRKLSAIDAANPQIFNGIPSLFSQQDFRNRSILLELGVIARRRSFEEMDQEVKAAEPAALGHLLKAMKVGLQNLSQTPTPQGLRMADAAKLVTAAESAFGWEAGTFVQAYQRNQALCIQHSLSTEPLYRVVKRYLDSKPENRLTEKATELLDNLEAYAKQHGDSNLISESGWPKAANALSAKLTKLEGSLVIMGIGVHIRHTEGGSMISLYKFSGQPPNSRSPTSVQQRGSGRTRPAAPANTQQRPFIPEYKPTQVSQIKPDSAIDQDTIPF